MSDTLADALNAPFPNGILVQRVAYGSLGDQFGIQPGRIPAVIAGKNILLGGDIIIALGGHPVSVTPEGLKRARHYSESKKVGAPLEITVYREGKKIQLTIPKPAQVVH